MLDVTECYAWQDLFASTGGKGWIWCAENQASPCECNGVDCSNAEGNEGLRHITGIDMQVNQMQGTLPESMGNMSQLTKLVLEFNQLRGTIPSSLSNLTKLQRLRLHCNRLTGKIPALNFAQYSQGCSLGGPGTKC